MNKEQLVCNLVSVIYGNKIVGFDKRDEFLTFLKQVIDLVNNLGDKEFEKLVEKVESDE
jgi:hypothetical protein